MANTKNHPYHILPLSPWPLCTSLCIFVLLYSGVMWMHGKNYSQASFAISLICLLACMYKWWESVIHEALIDKCHNLIVQNGLKAGMGLFILSEIMFFAVFFASIFHSSLFPVGILEGAWVVKAGIWPPNNIELVYPWNVPLMNTLILLLSGTTVTWAHYSLINNNTKDAAAALLYSIILGVTFTAFQALEYHHIIFKISDGIYPSNFYLATGFHGVHVIIGTIFLTICYFRTLKGQFDKPNSHLGFEFAAWYWHFVDVVWLFLFVFLYVLS